MGVYPNGEHLTPSNWLTDKVLEFQTVLMMANYAQVGDSNCLIKNAIKIANIFWPSTFFYVGRSFSKLSIQTTELKSKTTKISFGRLGYRSTILSFSLVHLLYRINCSQWQCSIFRVKWCQLLLYKPFFLLLSCAVVKLTANWNVMKIVISFSLRTTIK